MGGGGYLSTLITPSPSPSHPHPLFDQQMLLNQVWINILILQLYDINNDESEQVDNVFQYLMVRQMFSN
jgi:hypothetical protein